MKQLSLPSKFLKKLGVFCITLISISLFFYIFQSVKKRNDDFHRLIESQVPIFHKIHALNRELSLVTTILYSYYITTEQQLFQVKFNEKVMLVQENLKMLDKDMASSKELKTVELNFQKLLEISSVFIHIMQQPTIDWDKARSILAKLALADEKLHISSIKLTRVLEDTIAYDFILAMKYIHQIIFIITVFSFLLIISIVFLIKINKDKKTALAQKKIHLDFPIKNPTPVLALDKQGELLFANPAATKWALKFGFASPFSLLPITIDEYLTQSDKMQEWEYDNGVAVLKVRLLWLKSHARYHIYIDDLSELKKAERKLIKRSLTDIITLLPNRTCFNDDVASKNSPTAAFALINVSDFQRVIGIAGQNVIDNVVVQASKLINKSLDKKVAQLYRFDGNLFGIRFKNKEGSEVLQTILKSFESPLRSDGLDFYFTINIGLVFCENNKLSANELLMKTGVALDHLRELKGKNIQLYESSIETNLQQLTSLESDLYKALAKKELIIYFQPKVDTYTRETISTEALLRWKRNGSEWISPVDFIPIAERTGLIISIGDWVLKEACINATQWNVNRKKKVSVAVNISSMQFLHGDLVESVKSALSISGLEAKYLQLEITESVTLHDIDFVIGELNQLREMGVKIVLDDFGTGFSSLTYLTTLPLDDLKIDQSFIRRILTSKQNLNITHSMIQLAHDLGLCVIAEGVEVEEQYELLKSWSCNQLQGYLFAKPMPYQELFEYLKKNS